jgi:signal transduction histidine kinase
MTLRKRLFLFFSLFALLLLLVPGLLVGWAMRQHFQDQALKYAQDTAFRVQKFIDYQTEKGVLPGSHSQRHSEVKQTLSKINTYFFEHASIEFENRFFLELHDSRGKLLGASMNLGQTRLPRLYSGQDPHSTLSLTGNRLIPVLLIERELRLRQQPLGTLTVAVSLQESQNVMKRLSLFWLTVLGLGLLITPLLVHLFAVRVLSPLVALSNQIETMVSTETLQLLETKSLPDDPIGQLARVFNTLLTRIRDLLERQQRFISDASHELRSPLTAIQGHAELLLKRGSSHPELLSEGLGIIRDEAIRLSSLVGDLLLLIRPGQAQPRQQLLELNQVLREIVEARALLHPQLILVTDAQPCYVQGEKSSLQRVFINLIDNALRYGPPQSAVHVSVRQQEHRVCVAVQDGGPGIAADKLPHIFERFYRIEADRNRNQGGTGLGLAIAAEVVQWHLGQIEVNSQPGKGCCFKVFLPLTSPERQRETANAPRVRANL